MNPDNSSNENMKRAVSGALRAIAGEPELEVTFVTEPRNWWAAVTQFFVSGPRRAQLPAPSRSVSANELAVIRGSGRRTGPKAGVSRR